MKFKLKIQLPTYELRVTIVSYLSNFFSGIIMIKLFTHLMTPVDYGQLGLVSSISSLFITTFVSPFMQGASRYFIQTNPLLSFKYVESPLRKIQYTISIIFLIVVIYYLFVKEDFLQPIITLLLLLTLLIDSRGQWNTSYLHLKRKRLEYTFSTSIFNWLKIIVSVLFLNFFPQFPGIIFVLIAWIISSYVSNKYSQRIILKEKTENKESESDFNLLDKKNLKYFIINFFILNIFLWTQGWADKWILNYTFRQSSELGLYISYNQIAMIPFVALNGLIIMYFGPIIYQDIANSTSNKHLLNIKNKMNILKRYYVFLSFLSIFLLFFISPFVLKILLNNYKIDKGLFMLAASSSLLFNYSQIQSFSIQCTGRLKNILFPNIVVGILLVAINLILSRQYGVYGALVILNVMMLFKIILLKIFEAKSWKEYTELSFSVNKLI